MGLDGDECITSAVESDEPGRTLESVEEDSYPSVLADVCDGLYAFDRKFYGMVAEIWEETTYHCL